MWIAASRNLAMGLYLTLTGCASQRPQEDSPTRAISSSHQIRSRFLPGTVSGLRRRGVEREAFEDGTRIEILQLPLDGSGHLGFDRTQSQGRFMALQREFLDPATVPPGTRVLVTGEVTGSMTLPLDETEYTYPILEARHVDVLPPPEVAARWRRPYPYMGPYWGPYGTPYWRPWPYPF